MSVYCTHFQWNTLVKSKVSNFGWGMIYWFLSVIYGYIHFLGQYSTRPFLGCSGSAADSCVSGQSVYGDCWELITRDKSGKLTPLIIVKQDDDWRRSGDDVIPRRRLIAGSKLVTVASSSWIEKLCLRLWTPKLPCLWCGLHSSTLVRLNENNVKDVINHHYLSTFFSLT